MTVQLGMVGSDGVLLAGDTRISRGPAKGIFASRVSYDGPKIRISNDGRISVTCAHNLQVANNVADSIFANMTQGGHPTCEQDIRDCCTSAAAGSNVECVIAFAAPYPSLYLFQQYTDFDASTHIQSQRITGCVPIGDMQNPAVFWGMSYYKRLPIDRLAHLAACMVVAASALNSSIIGGFELVLCDKDGCRRLSDQSVRELEAGAKDKITRVGDLLYA
jgi:hypothetical protein